VKDRLTDGRVRNDLESRYWLGFRRYQKNLFENRLF